MKDIPQQSGLYKWYVEEDVFKELLEKLCGKYEELNKNIDLDINENKIAVYVGIAVRESVRNRLNWHINDNHSPSRIKSGYLSTLRKSIAACHKWKLNDSDTERKVNDFIDDCWIDYETDFDSEKNPEITIKEKEKKYLKEKLYILNIRDNNYEHSMRKVITSKLRKLRKEIKN